MNIPGYQLIRRLEAPSNHELHLATNEERLGHFVVRVQAFNDDQNGQRSFVETLDTLQEIRHPNLFEIVEFGEVEASVYVVTPYYPGGSLSDVLASGLSMASLLRIAKSICDALEVLHTRDLVHGDIKPSNVVFDNMGSPILIDYACLEPQYLGRAFTPGYSAPEVTQTEGASARSDIFSLGLLLYRILNGNLPWRVPDADVPRTRSATDSLPPLGPQHAAFQDLIAGMVAFEPNERIPDVTHVKRELERFDGTGELNTVSVKSDLISTAEISAVLPRHPDAGDSTSERSRVLRRASAVHWTFVCSVCFVALWSVTVGIYEIPATKRLLADIGIFENAALVEARLNAEALVADPNQNLQSIVAAYQAVLVIEPEDLEAIEAINDARMRWEDDFATALTQNDLSVAQNRLDDLLELFPDDVRSQAMFDELQRRRHALRLQSDTLALMRVTDQAPEASAEMALGAFREVIRLYPASIEAARELDELAAHFSAAATHEIEIGNLQAAMDSLSKASLANPGYSELATVREKIQRAATLQEEIETRIAEASDLRDAGQLIDPPQRNAATLFHSVLTTDPDNEVALRGLGDVSNLVVAQFEDRLEERDFGEIRHIIERAKTVGLYPGSIIHMESSLEQELDNISEAADFVVIAERMLADGYITEPLDNNALIALRKARSLDPMNTHVDELFVECVSRLSAVASDARTFGLDELATTYSTLAAQVAADASR